MILEWLIEPFAELAMLRRSFAGLLILSLGITPVGVFILLKRMSLSGDAIAHATLPGIAIGFLWAGLSAGPMILGGLLAGTVVVLVAAYAARNHAFASYDSSLASVHLIALAVGVMLMSLEGSTIDLLHVLFGSVLAVDRQTLIWIGISSLLTLGVVGLGFRVFVLDTLDPAFFRSLSQMARYSQYVLLFLVVLNFVMGFQAVGTLMVVGLMILPAATARFWTNSIYSMVPVALLIAWTGCFIGLQLSWQVDVPLGPMIIVTLGAIYFFSIYLGRRGGLLISFLNRKRRHYQTLSSAK